MYYQLINRAQEYSSTPELDRSIEWYEHLYTKNTKLGLGTQWYGLRVQFSTTVYELAGPRSEQCYVWTCVYCLLLLFFIYFSYSALR
jgi:hypothetical protein